MSSQTIKLTKPAKPVKAKKPIDLLPPLDWAASHGPISGALSSTTGAGAVALLGSAAGMPAVWPLAVGAAGALGHGIASSVHRGLHRRSITTRATSWLLAGGWTSWAMATGPLSWAALGTLAALGVGIGAMASNSAIHEEAVEEELVSAEAKQLARKLGSEREGLALEWEARIRRVTNVQVRVIAVEFWKTGAGFSLGAELPVGGATWDRIANSSRSLATDARLPLGCTIQVEEGDVQGRVVLDVATKNVMSEDYDYPDDYSALSILTGIPWGLLPNSDTVEVLLREACALILGPPGSGKSTFLDGVIAGFARCVDVLTFVIDFKGGAIGIPWVNPWLEATGRKLTPEGFLPVPSTTRPGIDWLASTPQEALRMTSAVLRINEARQQGYQQLMERKNTTLLPVSAKVPQIMLILDEGAELLSAPSLADVVMKQLQNNVKKIMRTTRAMGIRMVLTAVDGNVAAIGSTEVRKFAPVGVALTSGETSSGDNSSKLFKNSKVDTNQLKDVGTGVIGQAGGRGFAPTGFKGWKTYPSTARDVTVVTSARRPRLDDLSVHAAGPDYTERWSADRAGWLWAKKAEATDPAPQQPGDRPAGLNLSYNRPAPKETPDADALADKFMKEIDEEFGTTEEPQDRPAGLNLSYKRVDLKKPDADDADDTDAPAEQAQAPAAGPDWLPVAIDAIESAGAMGMKPNDIAALVGKDRKTIRPALQAACARGELIYRENGAHTVYIHRDHI